MQKTLFFRKQCADAGLKVAFSGPHFNETVLRFESETKLQSRLGSLATDRIFPGVALSRWYPEYEGHLLVSTTELHSDQDIQTLVQMLA
jgi:glycine dehydrogenase subunit 1